MMQPSVCLGSPPDGVSAPLCRSGPGAGMRMGHPLTPGILWVCVGVVLVFIGHRLRGRDVHLTSTGLGFWASTEMALQGVPTSHTRQH
jgi:hypothetical protein